MVTIYLKKKIMKNSIYIILSFLFIIIFGGCEADLKGPLVKDGIDPQIIKNITVENLPGASKISYTLPNDEDLLYVIATYSTKEGEIKQTKSSVFKNYVLIEGFSEIKEFSVSLRTVDRSNNFSPEVHVKINPLEAPIHEVLRTLKVKSTWGGAQVSLFNEMEKEYVLYTLLKDSITGNWAEYDRLYTQSKNRDFYARGLMPVPTEFAFFLTDKWLNKSDTIFITITPLFEIEFDKSLWKDLALPDDTNKPQYKPLYQLWTPGSTTYFFQDPKIPGIQMPNWITIDLGREYIFGRFKLNQVSHSNTWRYGSCSPRKFEVWVSNNPSTNWNDWTYLASFESIKPSGLPVGQLSADDLAMNANGEEYEFPILEKGYRYMRYKVLETWGNTTNFCALEFTLWGQPYESTNN